MYNTTKISQYNKKLKDCRINDHSTLTTCCYNIGYRTMKVDTKNGQTTTTYYSYMNGLPKKQDNQY